MPDRLSGDLVESVAWALCQEQLYSMVPADREREFESHKPYWLESAKAAIRAYEQYAKTTE